MSITINGHLIEKIPTYCGVCEFFVSGSNDKRGFCSLFEKYKSRYDNVPKRCNDIFVKGFATGGNLVIVKK